MTEASTGTLTSFANPTAVQLTAPREYPLTVRRRLHTIGPPGPTVVVAEEQTLTAGRAFNVSLRNVYVFDRQSMRSVASDRAYAYAPEHRVDRSPYYTVGLPVDSAAGPFPVWQDETGNPCPFAVDNPNVREWGVPLRLLICRRGGVPAQEYFVDQLAVVGLSKQLSLPQITPQLRAAGIDFQQIVDRVAPHISASDGATLRSILRQPVGLHYFVSYERRLLAEPRTGVTLHAADVETIEVQFDLHGVSTAEAVLGKRQYADDPVVVATIETLHRLIPEPPTYRLFSLSYSQTPRSIGAAVDYLAHRPRDVDSVATLVPRALLVTGVVTLLLGLVLTVRLRRRQSQGGS